MLRPYTCPECGRTHSGLEYGENRFCRDCGTWLGPREPMLVFESNLKYKAEQRIVAFLDILGFKNLVDVYIKDPNFIMRMDQILTFSKKLLKGEWIRKGHSRFLMDINSHMFSDSICISSPMIGLNIFNFLSLIASLQYELLGSGIFVRGGIGIGLHAETPRIIISEGLIKAFKLENSAKYPRILISRDIVARIEPHKHENIFVKRNFNRFIRLDNDGFYLLDYLKTHLFRPNFFQFDSLQGIIYHKKAVEDWINYGIKQKLAYSNLKKYKWIVRYHNDIVREYYGNINDLLINLHTLIKYEDKFSYDKSARANHESNQFKKIIDIPCLVCSDLDKCSKSGDINPKSCIDLENWIDRNTRIIKMISRANN